MERNFFYLKDRGLSWKVDKTSEGEKIQEKRRKSSKEGKNSGRTKKIFERRKKFRKKEEILQIEEKTPTKIGKSLSEIFLQ